MDDDFAVDLPSSTYSRSHFYCGSTDRSGHSAWMRVRIPPQVHGEIGALIAKRIFPDYQTFGHFVRDSVAHRLHDLSEMVEDPVVVASLERTRRRLAAMMQIEHLRQEIEDNEKTLANIRVLLSQPPTMETIKSVREMLFDVNDSDDKRRVSLEFELYQQRYQ
jgi:hypothetical protein